MSYREGVGGRAAFGFPPSRLDRSPRPHPGRERPRAGPFLRDGCELWYLAEQAEWGEKRQRDLEMKIAGHAIIFPDMRVAKLWAEMSRLFRGQLGPSENHDLWIAAGATVLGIPLITNNVKHFQPIAAAFPALQLVHPSL